MTTLSFALAVPDWLLQQPWVLGSGVDPGRPVLLGHALDSGHSYYYFALAVLVLAILLARNVRRGGFGQLLVAIRDNEDNARAFTVDAARVKLQGISSPGSSPASAARPTCTRCRWSTRVPFPPRPASTSW